MKTISKASISVIILSAGFALSNPAFADGCQRAKNKIERVFGTKQDTCVNIRKDADLTQNPFLYQNPDSTGCDLGLRLPGLPDFGSMGGFDLCGIAKTITSSTVNQVNGAMAQTTADAVNKANEASRNTAGVDVIGGHTDIGGAIQGTLQNP